MYWLYIRMCALVCADPNIPARAVRDEVTEPSAAGGGCSEAEEAQNKESHERTAK